LKRTISTDSAPRAIGPYAQAIQAGELLFISGQLPIDPATGEFTSDDVEGQTRQSLKNVKAIVESAGGSVESIVKTTVFLKNMSEFSLMNGEYSKVFQTEPPARAAVEVAALPKGALVEIEAIARIADD
jgi:2-iminobutanoate/2-iminopropanoate deaminase